MELKEIVICWDCAEPIKEIVVASDCSFNVGDSVDFYICGNVLCPRFGLASTAYKTKPQKGGEQTNG